ncbi:MAG: hypothetical protein GX088_01050 [Clostridia bacterium]|nr:hypothetical protein [Clostridia bacterium]
MKIHTEIKKDGKNERVYEVEVVIPKTNKPVIPGEESNKKVADILNYFEKVIMDHDWIEDMGYDEKIEVLRQYSLYWFLSNILQLDLYPLPKEGGSKPC